MFAKKCIDCIFFGNGSILFCCEVDVDVAVEVDVAMLNEAKWSFVSPQLPM